MLNISFTLSFTIIGCSTFCFHTYILTPKRIAGKAQSAQFSTSDFCRHAALGKEVRHIEGLNDCNYELNKIGNNINQLTLLCHQRRIDNPDLRSIHGRLCAVLESILERLDGG